MNKLLLSTALVAVLAAPSAFASSGKITITGLIVDGTCTVAAGTNTTGTGGDLTVALDTAHTSDLAAAASYAMTKDFDIKVGGGAGDTCNGKVSQLVYEDVAGGSMINADGFLDNTGTATNVGVRLLNGVSRAPINLKTAANNPTATPAAGTPGVLKYAAQYFSKAGGASAGTVNTYVSYTVAYN
ncbi:fimbrial protein [Lysobacter sp. LF1]|uniref:Fimbrial protein n=1 Tax=Lysobacter stagni TaxID=3045172 RepID=A0ABT6XKI9_9GAMM|nr:fimbrial protein [Lysobacter sp. LF1]MDI9240563.1 fimbrial protein [Lysobacter sp. LF1]